MKYLKLFESFSGRISENLQYHIDNNKPIVENVFRPGSNQYFNLIKEARQLFDANQIELSELDTELFESTDIGRFAEYEGQIVPLDLPMEVIEELKRWFKFRVSSGFGVGTEFVIGRCIAGITGPCLGAALSSVFCFIVDPHVSIPHSFCECLYYRCLPGFLLAGCTIAISAKAIFEITRNAVLIFRPRRNQFWRQ